MRVLLLGQHVFHEDTGGHEVIHRDPAAGPYDLEALLHTLPAGWAPDLIAYRIPEYHAVPLDMADAPCATVALVSDWNLHYESPRAVLGAFDHVFTERLGVETFRRAGFAAVSYFPLFGFRPHMHWRPDPPLRAEDYLYDVSIVANLSPNVQRERADWIVRLSRLHGRYRVAALTGLFEEAYTHAVQRTRITFNRSIRREMNMRAYEAPACGSLLFLEAENQEVGDFLQDGRECVLYGADDLEDKLAYYLEHEAERARIAEAGWRAIQPHTYENRLRDLIGECARLGLAGPARRRLFHALPEWRRNVLHARNLHTAVEIPARVVGIHALGMALDENPWEPEILNDMAVLLAGPYVPGAGAPAPPDATPENAQESLQVASGLLAEAVLTGGGAVALLNRAAVDLARGDRGAAALHLEQALGWLHNDVEPDAEGLLLAHPYEVFRLTWERAAWESPDDARTTWLRRRDLLRGEAWRRLGRLREEADNLDGAALAYREAVSAFPQVEAWQALSRIHVQRGQLADALGTLAHAVAESPLYLQLRWNLQQLLGAAGDPEGQRGEALTLLRLARTMSSFQGDPAPLEEAVRQSTLASAARAGGYARRLEILVEGLRVLPADRALQRAAGLLHAILGEDEAALRLLGEPSADDDRMQAAYRALARRREDARQALAGIAGDTMAAPPRAADGVVRVVHLHHSLPAGGVEQYILDLVKGRAPDVEHSIFLFQDGGELVEEARAAGARVEIFPVLGSLRDGDTERGPYPALCPQAFRDLVAALRAGGFDVAHLHFGGGDVIGHEAARRAGIPTRVETVHWTVNSIAPDLDAVICPSKLLMQLQAIPERGVHIPLGIDADRFRPAERSADHPVVGRVSRLVAEKDPATFVRAAALVQRASPEAEFVLVGDGPEREYLEALALEEGARVTFAGRLRGDALVAALQGMDVFAYTPRGESFGLVVAEAMACGLPVICTPIDALPELVRHNFNGTHVPPGDPAALAEALLRMLGDPRRRALMGKRGRYLVEQQLSRQACVAAHEALYRELTAAKMGTEPIFAEKMGSVPIFAERRGLLQRAQR